MFIPLLPALPQSHPSSAAACRPGPRHHPRRRPAPPSPDTTALAGGCFLPLSAVLAGAIAASVRPLGGERQENRGEKSWENFVGAGQRREPSASSIGKGAPNRGLCPNHGPRPSASRASGGLQGAPAPVCWPWCAPHGLPPPARHRPPKIQTLILTHCAPRALLPLLTAANASHSVHAGCARLAATARATVASRYRA